MARTALPPGFRFHPTDVELVMYYLKRKVTGKKVEAIAELNLYKFSPWDLPDKSCLKSKDLEWYFFCPRERKYASGARMNRATETGYWKTTGKDRSISYNDRLVGKVKTLVFHEGNAPHGRRTDWVIHEYRIEDTSLADAGIVQDSYVLCKVFHKNGPGPKNGAQYGAPFKEEEWDEDDDDTVAFTLPSNAILPPVHVIPENQNLMVANTRAFPGKGSRLLLDEAATSKLQSSSDKVHLVEQNCSAVTNMIDPGCTSGWSLAEGGPNAVVPNCVNDVSVDEADDIAYMLSALSEATPSLPHEDYSLQKFLDGISEDDLFKGLEDLGGLDGGGSSSGGFGFDDTFLELDDLDLPIFDDGPSQ